MNKVIYKDRRHSNSVKWDGCEGKFGDENLLPLWVADMDFEAPECVKKSLREYVDFGVFGYFQPPASYYDAFINWEKTNHGYAVEKEWIRFSPGVVPAFNWILDMLTQENDGVIIMSPVYYPFREAIVNNNRTPIESPLLRTENSYVMNYEDFEQKIIENHVKLFIFSSPHNPVGRVWKKEEIKKALDICKKHGVYVISDEIHQDLIMSGHMQIPSAMAGDYDDILITLTAATKTFNLAGCQNSILIIPNEKLRAMYDSYLERLRINGGNAFGYTAVESAYANGQDWLTEVLEIIEGNYHYLKETLEKHLPDVWISELQGTYLMWIDLGKYLNKDEIESFIQKQCKLAVDYGSWFGGEEYSGFIRVNLATKRENIETAAQNIIQALS